MTSAAALDARLRELHGDLASLRFGAEKKSLHENLTDRLEIVAVAADLKPAHVNGQGLRSESLLVTLEEIGPRHGLRGLRTEAIGFYCHRRPRFAEEVLTWHVEHSRRKSLVAHPWVLWLYKDPSIQPAIVAAVAGTASVAAALGYPECCVVRETETNLRFFEEMVSALQQQHGASSSSEIIRLLEADTKVTSPEIVAIFRQKMMESTQTKLRYPLLQLVACPPCLDSAESPAGRLNAKMRDLAVAVHPPLASMIKETIWADVLHGSNAPGRNQPCPCGSKRKFKKCCEPFRWIAA
jgi:hypothetical protein